MWTKQIYFRRLQVRLFHKHSITVFTWPKIAKSRPRLTSTMQQPLSGVSFSFFCSCSSFPYSPSSLPCHAKLRLVCVLWCSERSQNCQINDGVQPTHSPPTGDIQLQETECAETGGGEHSYCWPKQPTLTPRKRAMTKVIRRQRVMLCRLRKQQLTSKPATRRTFARWRTTNRVVSADDNMLRHPFVKFVSDLPVKAF